MAFSPKGPLWIANFGQWGTDGDVQVTKPTGASFGTVGLITNPAIQGPWGIAFAPSFTSADGLSSPPAFFVASALNGSIEAMYGFSPPTFNSDTKVLQIGSGLAHWGLNANNIVGPQGMAWDSMNDTLCVTDGADNSIRAYHWWGASTTDTHVHDHHGHPCGESAQPGRCPSCSVSSRTADAYGARGWTTSSRYGSGRRALRYRDHDGYKRKLGRLLHRRQHKHGERTHSDLVIDCDHLGDGARPIKVLRLRAGGGPCCTRIDGPGPIWQSGSTSSPHSRHV